MEFGGSPDTRIQRLAAMRALNYNDLAADRNTVAVVQALEAILSRQARGRTGMIVQVNATDAGLQLLCPGESETVALYSSRV